MKQSNDKQHKCANKVATLIAFSIEAVQVIVVVTIVMMFLMWVYAIVQ